jgi:signal transduction histidine kinase
VNGSRLRVSSLRARLLFAALTWIAIAVPIGGIALAFSFRSVVSEDFDNRLRDALLTLIGAVEVTPGGALTLARPLNDDRFEQVYSGWYWIVDSQRDPPLRSRSLWDLPFAVVPQAVSATAQLRTLEDRSGNSVRVAEQTVELSGLNSPVTFAITGNLAQLSSATRDFNRLLWLSLIALATGLIIAIVTQVSFGLRPLQRVASEVERIRTRQQTHLQTTGLSDIDLLVNQVNTLIDHDRAQLERSRGNAADLAHALKTPLAILRTSFDGAQHEEQRTQLDSVQRLIDRQLARAASSGPRPGVVTDVENTLKGMIDGLRRMHASRALQLGYTCAPGLQFAGDAEDLQEMLGNVLDNACKWARTRVLVKAALAEGELSVVVDDDGPGMTDAEASQATARGQRFDEQTPGTGLGLAIVSDLIEMYEGSIELSRGELGGTRVTLRLPSI